MLTASSARRMDSVAHLKPGCSTCSLSSLCLPLGLPAYDINKLDELIEQRKALRRGEFLYRSNDAFSAIYAVRRGSFKTFALTQDGREQVTGFHMTGEIMGIDAISNGRYTCHAYALDDSEVCVIPFSHLEKLLRELPPLQRNFHRIMSREIVNDQRVMVMLGNLRAEERLAAFLINLSERYAARGFSAKSFHLRMTRADIGSFTGMKLETVSRTFSKLQQDGYLSIHSKLITIDNMEGLRAIANQSVRQTLN